MLRRRSLLLTVLVLALTPATQAWAGTGDEIIVRRAPGLDAAERGALRRDADVEHVRDLGFGQVEVVEAAVGDRADALADLARDPDVLWAEPNSVVRATAAAPDDMHFGLQWALRNTGQSVGGVAGTAGADVGALQAWDRSTGAGVLVAVVDTGAQLAHPDLQLSGPGAERAAGNATNGIDDDGDGIVDDAAGYDWVDDDVTPEDLNGHGTHVAGIIAAAAGNRQGISGVAPDARVVPLRVLDASGSGSSADVAAAFDAAGRMGVRVVNASLGGGGSSYAQTLAIRSHPGTLYVVASGNDGRDVESTPTYPCAYPEPNVLCVGATDNRDALADFSNYGSTSVDLFAPGVMIASAWTGSGYRYANGTSMASPQAAGVAALLASRRPTATAAEIKAALMGGAAPVAALAGRSVTDGRLDAVGALDVLDGVRLAARVAPTVTATPVAPAPTAEVTELPSAGGPDTVAPGSDTPTEPAPASVPAGSAAPASPAPRATVPSVATPRAAAPTPAAADPETRKKAEAGVRLGTPKVSGTGRNRQLRFTVSRSSHVSVRLQRRVCRGARCHWTARAAASTAAARAGTVRVRLGERYAGVRLTRGTWRAEVLVGSVVRRAGFRVR